MALLSDVLRGVKWTAGGRILQQGLQFGLSVVLMRLLGPESFGLIGMVLVFTGFAGVFQDLGFSSALVQLEKVTEQHRSTAFWSSLALGVLIAATLSASSQLIAGFYDIPELRSIVIAVSTSFLASALGSVPRAILLRQMRFDSIAIVESMATVLSGTAAASAALMGLGVWALVLQIWVSSFVGSVGLFLCSPWRPKLLLSTRAFKDLWGFGAGLTGFTIVNYWARKADDLLIGKFFGSTALGLYSRAYSLMLLPLSQIMRVLSPVLFPALASIQHDHARVRKAYLRVISMLTYISFPLMFGIAATARPFILTLFGPEWAGLIPLTQILAIAGALGSLVSPLGVIFTSQGKTGTFFRIGLLSGGTIIFFISLGVYLGDVVAVAWCYLAGSILVVIPNYAAAGRLIHMRLTEVVAAVGGNFGCALAMAVIVAVTGATLTPSLPHPLAQLVLTAMGIAIFVGLSVIFDLPALRDLMRIARSGSRGEGVLGESNNESHLSAAERNLDGSGRLSPAPK